MLVFLLAVSFVIDSDDDDIIGGKRIAGWPRLTIASRDVADVDHVNRVNSANVIQDDFEYILGMRVFNFMCVWE